MRIFQLQGKAFSLAVSHKGSAIIRCIAEDGTMIEMRQHLLPLASMLIVVADGTEDETVVGVVNPVLIMRLRLEQGIARHLPIAFDAHSTSVQEAIEVNKFDERRVGTLLHYLLDAVERGADLRIPMLAGQEQLSYYKGKDYSK